MLNLNLPIIAALSLTAVTVAAAEVETRAYFSTNPNNAVGKNATIRLDDNFKDWTEDMVIATNGANNVATAYKGSHENNVLDIYAMFAAWDDNNLYIAWQMCNTGDVWAREGDGPLTDYGKIGDVPMVLALSVDPSKQGMNGLLENGNAIWNDSPGHGVTFDYATTHVDHLLFMSAKPGQGTPAMFTPVNTKGETNYGSGCQNFSSLGITYNRLDGFNLSELWRCRSTAEWYTPTEIKSDPSVVNDIYDIEKYDNLLAGPIAGLKNHDTSYDTFFEIQIPLKALGINREWLESNGIGARICATRGESALDCCPFDPSMMDNALGEYGKDNSTTHEKDDIDLITYAMADIAKIRDLSNIEPLPTPDDPTPDDPVVVGEYNVYYEGTVKTHTYIWDDGNNNFQYAGAWPGTLLTEVNINGRTLKKFSFTPDTTPVNLMIIFNNGSDNSKTPDLKYVNNGIYNDNGYTGETLVINTDIDSIENEDDAVCRYFDFTGTPLPAAPEHGMYIRVQGNKVEKLAR